MRALLLGIGLVVCCQSAFAVETINYNNRQYTIVDVVAKSGLSTAHAVIRTLYTRRDAKLECDSYDESEAKKEACIELELKFGLQPPREIHADCIARTFTNCLKGRYRFAGERKNTHPGEFVQGDDAKFSIIEMGSGQEETDGPTFYTTDLDIFRALCPKQAPPASAGYYLYKDP